MRKYVETTKAYHNSDFLNSSPARSIRLLCEYEEGMHRLNELGVNATILVFGSARAKPQSEYDAALAVANQKKEDALAAGNADQVADAEKNITRIRGTEWMCAVYENVCQLSKRLTEWSMDPNFVNAEDPSTVGVSRYLASSAPRSDLPPTPSSLRKQTLVMCTGGGPGFMEAANKGAYLVEGARSVGFGISLPFEKGVNEFVTPQLAFEFHYFFMRKFLMTYFCQALIVAPGGLGTMDELFELLTLRQTGKISPTLPFVLFGKRFWETAVNWHMLVEMCVISPHDLNNMLFTDDVTEACQFIIAKLQENGVIVQRRELPAVLVELSFNQEEKMPFSG